MKQTTLATNTPRMGLITLEALRAATAGLNTEKRRYRVRIGSCDRVAAREKVSVMRN